METRHTMSESTLEVAERACDLVAASDDRLKAVAHGRSLVDKNDVKDSLLAAEIALRQILLSGAA
jgi:hypothetical protein